ncbi:hypothetical protein ACVWZW_009050 [Bradyrhizobium sp. F1.13.4]
MIEIGAALSRAKERIKHGQFQHWVIEQCGFTMRSAQNYMRGAALAAEHEIVSHLNPAALYRLAAPKTPSNVTARIISVLREGSVPTEHEIIDLIAAQTPERKKATPLLASGDRSDEREFARELYSRLGEELTSELVERPWRAIRECLREELASGVQSSGAHDNES